MDLCIEIKKKILPTREGETCKRIFEIATVPKSRWVHKFFFPSKCTSDDYYFLKLFGMGRVLKITFGVVFFNAIECNESHYGRVY